MLLTESAAREKWCPFARVAAASAETLLPSPGPAHNRIHLSDGKTVTRWGKPDASVCLASDCMSWRWAGWRNKTFGTVAPCPDPVERDGERLGFCGLAGKPDMGRAAS